MSRSLKRSIFKFSESLDIELCKCLIVIDYGTDPFSHDVISGLFSDFIAQKDSSWNFKDLNVPVVSISNYDLDEMIFWESANFKMMHSCYINHFICNHWFNNWIIQGDALILNFIFKRILFDNLNRLDKFCPDDMSHIIWPIWYGRSIVWVVCGPATMT